MNLNLSQWGTAKLPLMNIRHVSYLLAKFGSWHIIFTKEKIKKGRETERQTALPCSLILLYLGVSLCDTFFSQNADPPSTSDIVLDPTSQVPLPSILKTGLHCTSWAGLKLLGSSNPSASVSQVAEHGHPVFILDALFRARGPVLFW